MNSDIRSAPMSPLVVCSLQMFSILLPNKFYVFRPFVDPGVYGQQFN